MSISDRMPDWLLRAVNSISGTGVGEGATTADDNYPTPSVEEQGPTELDQAGTTAESTSSNLGPVAPDTYEASREKYRLDTRSSGGNSQVRRVRPKHVKTWKQCITPIINIGEGTPLVTACDTYQQAYDDLEWVENHHAVVVRTALQFLKGELQACIGDEHSAQTMAASQNGELVERLADWKRILKGGEM